MDGKRETFLKKFFARKLKINRGLAIFFRAFADIKGMDIEITSTMILPDNDRTMNMSITTIDHYRVDIIAEEEHEEEYYTVLKLSQVDNADGVHIDDYSTEYPKDYIVRLVSWLKAKPSLYDPSKPIRNNEKVRGSQSKTDILTGRIVCRIGHLKEGYNLNKQGACRACTLAYSKNNHAKSAGGPGFTEEQLTKSANQSYEKYQEKHPEFAKLVEEFEKQKADAAADIIEDNGDRALKRAEPTVVFFDEAARVAIRNSSKNN